MNKNETQAIDEATAKAEAQLILTEAENTGHPNHFLHFVFGWMRNEHYAEMAKAAESWIESENYTRPEEDN